jgi:Domain of unknown function (DUF4326)
MALDLLTRRPERLQRERTAGWQLPDNAVFVGQGTKWKNPLKKRDVVTLLSEPDIAAAYKTRGWQAAANIAYRDYLVEEGLDVTELRGKDLVCICGPDEPCHADVLLELANQQ